MKEDKVVIKFLRDT